MAGFPRLAASYDFAILGGGHAGLQAALKASLVRHTAVVVDRGPKYGRSFYAPKMVNIPGFPEGISGHKLLDAQIAALRPHAARVTYVTPALATGARRTEGGFEVSFDWLRQPRTVTCRALVLALGVVDRMPEIDGQIDAVFPWANQALVDFCLVCDGWDLEGKRVGVLGHDDVAAQLALDIGYYAPASVELVTHGRTLLEGVAAPRRAELERSLDEADVTRVSTPIVGYDGLREHQFHVRFADGTTRVYDRGFSGLGWYSMHDAIPRSLGSGFDPEGYVRVDDDGRVLDPAGAPIPGLYAIGDLRSGWNLIPEAWASAERAVLHAYAQYL